MKQNKQNKTKSLYKILDKWKVSVSQKNVNLALLIDFKKSFDIINPRLEFLKPVLLWV